jgi:hypothetical protein
VSGSGENRHARTPFLPDVWTTAEAGVSGTEMNASSIKIFREAARVAGIEPE